jgi:hypothetical protein
MGDYYRRDPEAEPRGEFADVTSSLHNTVVALDRQRCVQSRQSVAASQDAIELKSVPCPLIFPIDNWLGTIPLTDARCASKGAVSRKLMEELEVIAKWSY